MKDLLKYYIALQPKIKEAMGEWKLFDGFIWKNKKYPKERSVVTVLMDVNLLNDNDDIVYRIPLTIDPVNPERGLWGMVNWNRFDVVSNGYGVLTVRDWKNNDPAIIINANSPTEAILKALCEQEGVNV